MTPTSPAATVLDEVGTWAGITQDPQREAPPQSCSKALSSATFTRTAARSTFPSSRPGVRKCSKQDGPRNGSPAVRAPRAPLAKS